MELFLVCHQQKELFSSYFSINYSLEQHIQNYFRHPSQLQVTDQEIFIIIYRYSLDIHKYLMVLAPYLELFARNLSKLTKRVRYKTQKLIYRSIYVNIFARKIEERGHEYTTGYNLEWGAAKGEGPLILASKLVTLGQKS